MIPTEMELTPEDIYKASRGFGALEDLVSEGYEPELTIIAKAQLAKAVKYILERWNGTKYEDKSSVSEVYAIVAIPLADIEALKEFAKWYL